MLDDDKIKIESATFERLLEHLRKNHQKKVGFTSGHGEWMKKAKKDHLEK